MRFPGNAFNDNVLLYCNAFQYFTTFAAKYWKPQK